MVIIYTSGVGPFEYLIGERRKEVEIMKKEYPTETTVASPMLVAEKFLFVIQQSSIQFDWKRNETVEEVTCIMEREFPKSSLQKIDFFDLGSLQKFKKLIFLRKNNCHNRVDSINNVEIDWNIWKSRRIGSFELDENHKYVLVIIGEDRLSTPINIVGSEHAQEENPPSTSTVFIRKQKTSNGDVHMRILRLGDDKIANIKSQRPPVLQSSQCMTPKRKRVDSSSKDLNFVDSDCDSGVNKERKKMRLCFSGPQIVQNLAKNLKSNEMKCFAEGASKMNSVKLTAKLTGVSPRTIYRNARSIRNQKTKLKMTRKATQERAANSVSKENKMLLRQQLDRWWKDEIEVTVKKVCDWMSSNLGLAFGEFKMRKILRGIGLTFKKKNRNSVIEERLDLVKWRFRFLLWKMNLKRSRIPVLYAFQDETWVYSGMVSRKGWQLNNGSRYDIAKACGFNTHVSGPVKGRDKGVRAIVLSVITQLGILKDSTRVVISGLPESQQKEDYHHQMDSVAFMQYMRKVIKNLSELANEKGMRAVLLVDNASYHSQIRSKAPTSQSNKSELLEFLNKHAHNISENFNHKMTNTQLFAISRRFVDANGGIYAFREYELDLWAKEEYDVEVGRLPPYHSHFNAIELLWADMKGYLKRTGKTTDKIAEVRLRALSFLDKFDASKCARLINHVESIEQQHRFLLGIR